MSDNLGAFLVALLGLGLAIVLGRLFLGGVLKATFHRARTIVRRLIDRRATPRPDSPDRRQAERRQ